MEKKENNKGIGNKKKQYIKKRIKVEQFFSRLKQNKLVNTTFKKIESIYNLIYSR